MVLFENAIAKDNQGSFVFELVELGFFPFKGSKKKVNSLQLIHVQIQNC
jgi:hypothetical protein